ncbi:MAG: penicillin-binding transpeptidase domain-containing protein [Rudaea sp.]
MLDFSSEPASRRTFLKMLGLGGLAVVVDACGIASPTPSVASVSTTPSPGPLPASGTARAFLEGWGKADYAGMYLMLSSKSQASISKADFAKRYQSVASEATVSAIKPQLGSVLEQGNTAAVEYKTHLETVIFGPIDEDNAFSMVREGNHWGIVWSPGLILKDLGADGTLRFHPAKSTRGNIYDRNGKGISIGQKAIEVSVWPAEMRRNGTEAQVLAALPAAVNLSQFEIQKRYANLDPEWRIPIATVSPDLARKNADALSLAGVVTEEKDARFYPPGAAVAHIAGYVGQITADELGEVYARGYREGDVLGRAGLEKAGDKYLTGVRGGRLVVIGPNGEERITLKDKPAQQSQSIYSTIDLDLQLAADSALGDKRGSITVMNIKTGEILAMVSHPSYDPNAFVDSTRQKERATILTSPAHLLLNRSTQGSYPQGSVQKIVTTAAALERGGLAASTTFNCQGTWSGAGMTKTCWILAYGKVHGIISLQHALTASCDVTFYQVGQRLDRVDKELMPSFAYAFGLGAPTGIDVEESTGNVPDPKDQQPWIPNDPVDMAIGQDTFLTSPIQIIDFVAAVANGGTLWRPRLISKVQDIVNGTEEVPPSDKRGTLPVSDGNLKIIRDALKGVTTDKDGTAKWVFDGLPVISAGKTGTAQVPGANDPHAWFAGYAPADSPEIACVVMVENGGEGSKVSAPIFRKVIEKHFKVEPTPTPGKGPATPTGTPEPHEGD